MQGGLFLRKEGVFAKFLHSREGCSAKRVFLVLAKREASSRKQFYNPVYSCVIRIKKTCDLTLNTSDDLNEYIHLEASTSDQHNFIHHMHGKYAAHL